MDDASTGAMLADLLAAPARPDLTIAYFADNDYRSHEVGPHAALPVIERVDRMLGAAFEAGGGIERVLADTCVIVTSDHGHCDILPDADEAVIRLDRTLRNFRQAELGAPWGSRDQVLICPNMRASQIYLREPTADVVERIAGDLLTDPRIDQVIWRTRLTTSGAAGYTVATARGRLEFSRHPEIAGSWPDAFGGLWTWRGEAAAVGLVRDGR